MEASGQDLKQGSTANKKQAKNQVLRQSFWLDIYTVDLNAWLDSEVPVR